MRLTRRKLLQIGAAATLSSMIPRQAFSEGSEVYFVSYPGSIDDGFKNIVGPAYSRLASGTAIFTPMLNDDLIGKLKAAQSNPPFDVCMFDDGPLITAIRNGLVEKFDGASFPEVQALPEKLRNPSGYGPAFGLTAIGIAYNPEKVKVPPTSWADLWNPEYKGRVGIVGPASTLGTTFLIEVAKMNGGSADNVEPGFEALQKLLPQIGAIAPTPGALATMFTQGQVDIAPQYFNNVASLRSRGGQIAFAKPKEGLTLQTMTLCKVANAPNSGAGDSLLRTILNQDVMRAFEADPYVVLPSRSDIKLTGQNAQLAIDINALLSEGRFLDWSIIVDKRADWVDRFNREVSL
jgi:putative spermidine/putrescine transport system substrate-binding protein